MRTSRWKRYDSKSGLWIPSNKRIYLYWYAFLQHAEQDSGRQVDWSKYNGWGGAEAVLSTKFDVWWRKHWKDLFGYRLNETEPRFPLSTNKPQPDGVRYALMVYELKEEMGEDFDYWDIAKSIAQTEYPRRKYKASKDPNYRPEAWSFNVARPVVRRRLERDDKVEFSKQKRIISSRLARYLSAAEKHLDGVCVGVFPGT